MKKSQIWCLIFRIYPNAYARSQVTGFYPKMIKLWTKWIPRHVLWHRKVLPFVIDIFEETLHILLDYLFEPFEHMCDLILIPTWENLFHFMGANLVAKFAVDYYMKFSVNWFQNLSWTFLYLQLLFVIWYMPSIRRDISVKQKDQVLKIFLLSISLCWQNFTAVIDFVGLYSLLHTQLSFLVLFS